MGGTHKKTRRGVSRVVVASDIYINNVMREVLFSYIKSGRHSARQLHLSHSSIFARYYSRVVKWSTIEFIK